MVHVTEKRGTDSLHACLDPGARKLCPGIRVFLSSLCASAFVLSFKSGSLFVGAHGLLATLSLYSASLTAAEEKKPSSPIAPAEFSGLDLSSAA